MGEFAIDAEYKIMNNFSLKAGYTGILVTGIGRASNRVVYALPDIGIRMAAIKNTSSPTA